MSKVWIFSSHFMELLSFSQIFGHSLCAPWWCTMCKCIHSVILIWFSRPVFFFIDKRYGKIVAIEKYSVTSNTLTLSRWIDLRNSIEIGLAHTRSFKQFLNRKQLAIIKYFMKILHFYDKTIIISSLFLSIVCVNCSVLLVFLR